MDQANIYAARGLALREFPLNTGYSFSDYLLYSGGNAAGVIEAKKVGATLTGAEAQSARYDGAHHHLRHPAAALHAQSAGQDQRQNTSMI